MFESIRVPKDLYHHSNRPRLPRGEWEKMLIRLVHNATTVCSRLASGNLISSLSAVGDNQSAFTISITLQSKSNESALEAVKREGLALGWHTLRCDVIGSDFTTSFLHFLKPHARWGLGKCFYFVMNNKM